MLHRTLMGAALALSFCMLPLVSIAESEHFSMDVPFEVLARERNQILLSDLRVGDAALITLHRLCGDREGRVFVIGHSQVVTSASQSRTSASQSRSFLEVRMLPGRELDLAVADNESQSDERALQILFDLQNLQSCEVERILMPVTLADDRFQLFQVRTINGYSALSDFFAQEQ